jgi:hypothetical protein
MLLRSTYFAPGDPGSSPAPANPAAPTPASGAPAPTAPAFFIQPSGEYVANFWEHPTFKALAPDLVDNLQIRTHKGVADTYKGFASLHKLVGFDKIPVPAEGSPDEVWGQVADRLGRPRTPAEYKLPDPRAAGLDEKTLAPREFIDGVLQDMHAAELTQRQAERLLTRWNKRIAAHAQATARAHQEATAAADTALRGEWGAQYEANGALAERFLRSTMPAEQFEGAKSLLEQPGMRRYFHGLARQLQEPNPDTHATPPADVAAQAEAKLNAIRATRNHPAFDRDHPEHAAANAEVMRLQEIVANAKKGKSA